MTIARDMRRAAGRAKALLGNRAGRAVEFLQGRLCDDGGFRGRSDRSDLYYGVFGAAALSALGADWPTGPFAEYLRTFGDGRSLDLVHLACLIRCWECLGGTGPAEQVRRGMLDRLETFRSGDGGYAARAGSPLGSAYACFLAVAARQDLAADIPDPAGVVRCLAGLRTPEGGYANDRQFPAASAPVTAGVVTVLRHLGEAVPAAAGDWLLRCRQDDGGFAAMPSAGSSDLLSTATALHALAGMGVPLDEARAPCLAFVESLWDDRGGFRGSAGDAMLDCEYVYYGLLALGHLGEAA